MPQAKTLVKEWMATRLIRIAPDMPLIEAINTMVLHEIRHLPVVDDETLVGLVTKRDIQRKLPVTSEDRQAVRKALYATKVTQAMIPRVDLVTVSQDEPVVSAAKTMLARGVSSALVIDGERLAGIITNHDCLKALVELLEASAASPK